MSADQLAAHALDLFAPLGPGVVARRMFGGLGLYLGGLFFGIGDPDEGRLFLKVDDATRQRFLDAGGQPFTYRLKAGSVMTMDGYLTPPDDALEDPEAMLPWARLAVEAARRAAVAKGARASQAAARKATRTKAAGKGPARREPAATKPAARRPPARKRAKRPR
jgi:DNA transformation protein and related proteins